MFLEFSNFSLQRKGKAEIIISFSPLEVGVRGVVLSPF